MILHIGLPRTGTTTLQKFLFSDETLFAPPRSACPEISRLHLIAGIGNALPDSLADLNKARDILDKVKRSSGKNKVILISQERITSLGNNLAIQKIYAHRLKQIDPEARVIITLRRQQGLITSRFTQMKVRKHWAALGLLNARRSPVRKTGIDRKLMRKLYVPPFVDWAKMGLENQFSCWFSIMNYYDLYNSYAEVLGRDNVKILFFEDMKSNKVEFSQQLADFIGIDFERIKDAIVKTANKSPKGIGFLNRVITNTKKPGEGVNLGYALRCLMGIEKKAHENNPELLELVRSTFGWQNRKLSEILNAQLSLRGYLMDTAEKVSSNSTL